jgi:hypothetical protein
MPIVEARPCSEEVATLSGHIALTAKKGVRTGVVDEYEMDASAASVAGSRAQRGGIRCCGEDAYGRSTSSTAIGVAEAMTRGGEDDDIAPRADKLYAARSALAEAQPATRRLGIAEIVQFLNDPERSLSMEEQRALFADPRLRADYRRLKSRQSVVELPALAAASVGSVDIRRFEGGTVRIHPSRVAGQVYVVVRFRQPAADAPRSLVLESSAGELVKRPLPAANATGEIMMVLDRKRAADEAFLRLISDPTSTGSFLP